MPINLDKVNLPFDISTASEQCRTCVAKQLKKYEKWIGEDGRVAAGKFLVPCFGIPKEYIDPALKAIGDEELWEELIAVKDIVSWAKKYLTLDNNKPWDARWYQAEVLRCTSRRKMLRIARRTGKTDLVCVEICFKLFTEPNIKLILALVLGGQVIKYQNG